MAMLSPSPITGSDHPAASPARTTPSGTAARRPGVRPDEVRARPSGLGVRQPLAAWHRLEGVGVEHVLGAIDTGSSWGSAGEIDADEPVRPREDQEVAVSLDTEDRRAIGKAPPGRASLRERLWNLPVRARLPRRAARSTACRRRRSPGGSARRRRRRRVRSAPTVNHRHRGHRLPRRRLHAVMSRRVRRPTRSVPAMPAGGRRSAHRVRRGSACRAEPPRLPRQRSRRLRRTWPTASCSHLLRR